jgi:hypothetical protein
MPHLNLAETKMNELKLHLKGIGFIVLKTRTKFNIYRQVILKTIPDAVSGLTATQALASLTISWTSLTNSWSSVNSPNGNGNDPVTYQL